MDKAVKVMKPLERKIWGERFKKEGVSRCG